MGRELCSYGQTVKTKTNRIRILKVMKILYLKKDNNL